MIYYQEKTIDTSINDKCYVTVCNLKRKLKLHVERKMNIYWQISIGGKYRPKGNDPT